MAGLNEERYDVDLLHFVSAIENIGEGPRSVLFSCIHPETVRSIANVTIVRVINSIQWYSVQPAKVAHLIPRTTCLIRSGATDRFKVIGLTGCWWGGESSQ